MKKKLLIAISMAVLVMCLFAISVSAATLIDGLYYDLSGTGDSAVAKLTSDNVKCTLENVVIPETVTYDNVTYNVTTVNGSAFSGAGWPGNKTLKSITIPKSVTSIGEHAFRNCTSLETVTIKATGIKFSNAEFYGCTSIVSVDMSESTVNVIGSHCFRNCSNLVTVKYPPTLTTLGERAFEDCAKLESGDLSKTNLSEIEAWAFGKCVSVKSFKFPNTLKSISNNVFQNSTVTSVVLPDSLEKVSNHAFAFCNDLSLVVLPADLSAFSGAGQFFIYCPNVKVIIYEGENASDVKSALEQFSNAGSDSFANYNPNTTPSSQTVFTGAKLCGSCNGILGQESFNFVDLLTEMKIQTACTNCDYANVKANYKAVFECLGYSKSLTNGAIIQGFKINTDSVSVLEENGYGVIGFGVLAVSDSKLNGSKTAFDENGNAKEYVVVADGSEFLYDVFEIKVKNIPLDEVMNNGTSYADALIHLCAYATMGDTVYYISNGEISTELLSPVSYNLVK